MKIVNNLRVNMKKITKILLPIILVTTMTACQQKQNTNDQKTVDNQNNTETEQIQTDDNKKEVVEEPVSENTQSENTNTENNSTQTNESEVVSYFNNLQNDFEQIDSFDSNDVKNWAFDKLESTVNFVTNKEPIGNIYFKDLTGTAKGVVVGTLTYMDEKLVALCPDYKDKAASVFNKTKDELSNFKDTVEKSIGEQIGVDKYNEIKSNTKEKISDVKDKLKDGYTKVKEKIKKWYSDNTQ